MIAEYVRQRDRLLSRIAASLTDDPRFVAAWLGGSFGAGNADDVSDLDLVVVVSHAVANRLCARPDADTARPPVERLTLFEQFGVIAFA